MRWWRQIFNKNIAHTKTEVGKKDRGHYGDLGRERNPFRWSLSLAETEEFQHNYKIICEYDLHGNNIPFIKGFQMRVLK